MSTLSNVIDRFFVGKVQHTTRLNTPGNATDWVSTCLLFDKQIKKDV